MPRISLVRVRLWPVCSRVRAMSSFFHGFDTAAHAKGHGVVIILKSGRMRRGNWFVSNMSPAQEMTARWMTFFNSLTFPGQG